MIHSAFYLLRLQCQWETLTKKYITAQVIKIGGVPEELTVENLVPKILALKKDESPIPIIEPGLPYMDGRAVAYLLKDLTKHDKVDRAMEIFQWLRKQYPKAEYNHLYWWAIYLVRTL